MYKSKLKCRKGKWREINNSSIWGQGRTLVGERTTTMYNAKL